MVLAIEKPVVFCDVHGQESQACWVMEEDKIKKTCLHCEFDKAKKQASK